MGPCKTGSPKPGRCANAFLSSGAGHRQISTYRDLEGGYVMEAKLTHRLADQQSVPFPVQGRFLVRP